MATADLDFRPLAYSLCEQRKLPVLVTDLIAAYLDEQDLLCLNNVSRAIYDHATVLRHHNIDLDLSKPETSGRKALLLFRTLLTNKTAASAVRSLALTGDVLEEWRDPMHYHEQVHTHPIEEPFRGQTPPAILLDLADFGPPEIERCRSRTQSFPNDPCSSDSQISLSWLCASIIGLCSHLEDLEIGSDYSRYPDFRNNLQYLFESKHLKNLQSTNFCLDLLNDKGRHVHVTAVRDWDDILLLPFREPNIESISTVMTLAKGKLGRLQVSSLKKLVLHHVQVEPSDLDALLAATPKLSYFEYHASIDDEWCWRTSNKDPNEGHNMGLEPLFRALHYVSDTLQELRIFAEFEDESFGHGFASNDTKLISSLRHREEMSTLKCLHALSIPYSVFFGWQPPSVNTFEWNKILPASIRQITLTEDLADEINPNRWYDAALMPIIASLLEWMANNTHGMRPLKFNLLVLEHDSQIDFSDAVQALSVLCDEYRVRISIEMGDTEYYKIPGHHGVHRGDFTCVFQHRNFAIDPVEAARQIEANRLRLAQIR